MASSSSPAAETHIAQCCSGINVANFVSSKLRRDGMQNNYKLWKEQMLCLIESQGLLNFIDDEAPRPSPKDGESYVAWRRTDRLVKGWILGALSDETLEDFVSHMDSAANDVWIDLEKAFCARSEDASGINVANIVDEKLSPGSDWNSYTLWKQQMLSLVQKQNFEYLLDIRAHPPPKHDANYGWWRQSSDMVKDWILEALSDELAEKVVHLDWAKDVWLYLKHAFHKPEEYAPPQHPSGINVAKIVQVKRSRINVAKIVQVKLSGGSDWNSYKLWKRRMLDLVQSQNLGSFLDSTARPPPKYHVNYGEWRQSDSMVKGWILEALSDELAQQVRRMDLNSAKAVWLDLEGEFRARSKLTRQEEKEYRERLEWYKVAMSGDLAKAEMILKQNPNAIGIRLDNTLETPLHVAVGSGKTTGLVEKLVELSDVNTLFITDSLGFNPLHIAARTGNHRAAELLIDKLPDLLYALSVHKLFPIHLAAKYGHRETVELLMHHTRDDLPSNPFGGHSGFHLLHSLIRTGFLDIALELVNRRPDLAWIRMKNDDAALCILASTDTVSAARLNFWETLVYSC